MLLQAQALGNVGRYQLEAAIQSVHAARRVSATTDWPAIAALYDGLFRLTGLPVVGLNRAVALAEVDGPQAGLRALPVPDADNRLQQFQPYWAARAELLARAGKVSEALAAYDLAIGLATDDAQRLFLLTRRDALARSGPLVAVVLPFSPVGRR